MRNVDKMPLKLSLQYPQNVAKNAIQKVYWSIMYPYFLLSVLLY